MDTKTKTWLKGELVSALGFAEVDEIVSYIASTFSSKQEVSSYLIELLGIPAARAEHISTRLFSPEPSAGRMGAKGGATEQEGLVPRPTAVNSRLKPNKKNKKSASTLLNNALIINCLRCGRIEYNGARRCIFCDTELRYEADATTADQAAQKHMEELVQLDETGAERTRVLDAEQYFYDEEQVEKQESDDSSSHARRPITMALDLDNKQFVDVKITRNEQLAKDARELVDGVQRKMNKGKRGKGSFQQQTEAPQPSDGIREALVVVDDSYNLVFV
ncbi:Zinc ion binding protein [Phytophthora palmivora]|uniref:Zinc ion binding protein n=1 Tax=Phytophthora palmivora TaxID=4796 RepID=A0A2P4X2A0_9STRA|nr:Zinc ion binding protein [Phytophthora palmivora]